MRRTLLSPDSRSVRVSTSVMSRSGRGRVGIGAGAGQQGSSLGLSRRQGSQERTPLAGMSESAVECALRLSGTSGVLRGAGPPEAESPPGSSGDLSARFARFSVTDESDPASSSSPDVSPSRSIGSSGSGWRLRSADDKKNKLLLLDLNGTLLERMRTKEYQERRSLIGDSLRPCDSLIRNVKLWKRPNLTQFIEFLFTSSWHIGVWSSANEANVLAMSKYVFGDLFERLVCVLDRRYCDPSDYKPYGTVKDAGKHVWGAEAPITAGWSWNNMNTLILDDEVGKVNTQLSNAILVATYEAGSIDEEDEALLSVVKPLLEAAESYSDVRQGLKAGKAALRLTYLEKLNNHMEACSYIAGTHRTEADTRVFSAIGAPPSQETFPHAHRWYHHIRSVSSHHVDSEDTGVELQRWVSEFLSTLQEVDA